MPIDREYQDRRKTVHELSGVPSDEWWKTGSEMEVPGIPEVSTDEACCPSRKSCGPSV
jgi:hypothetical protein